MIGKMARAFGHSLAIAVLLVVGVEFIQASPSRFYLREIVGIFAIGHAWDQARSLARLVWP